MNYRQRLLVGITILFLSTVSLVAETITFRADSMTGNAGENRRSTTLTGNAFVQTKDIEIAADVIELSGANYDTVSANGNVSGTSLSSGFTFTCNTLVYNKKTNIVTLQGEVTLIDEENGVHAESHFMEYNQNNSSALMQIAVHITQKESDCTCAMAVYHKDAQMLEMSGSPQVTKGSDTFKAQEISFNLKSGEIVLDGRVRGTVQDQQKKEDAE